jgi:hypothetical protein
MIKPSRWGVLTSVVVVALGISAYAGQKYAVKVIDRQENSSSYTYAVPGYSTTQTTGNVNCTAYGNSANCRGAANSTSVGTSSYVTSYQVQGATLALQLPDGRIAVVNCKGKFNWTDWSNPNQYRSCRVPLTNDIEAEFDGDKAKLKWSVSIDGKKMESETYKILTVLAKPEPSKAVSDTETAP